MFLLEFILGKKRNRCCIFYLSCIAYTSKVMEKANLNGVALKCQFFQFQLIITQ